MRWLSLMLLLASAGCPTFQGTGDKDPGTTFGGDDDDDDDDDDTNPGDDDDDTNPGDDDDDTNPGDDDDDTVPTDCSAGPDETGPWPEHPISEAGAPITRDPYTFDAGVSALLAAAEGNYNDVAVDLLVEGAIVTSRGYVPANPAYNTATFWFEDSGGAMMAFIVDIGQDPNNLQPGDEVSFRATTVKEYFGTPEVIAITDFQILSSGNPVHVVDAMNGDVLSFDTHGLRTIEIWGGLVSGPEDCGANCFDFDYGAGLVTYRTNSSYDVVGDCIHYIGPLSQFNNEPQIDIDDFDWAWRF